MPVVSVIIPTYKHEKYILATLESVFAQSYTDYEIIVVNDGSPDDTELVLRPLAESGKIRYLQQENAGQAAARNRGLAVASGELIALLDDDDLWPPDKLAWQVKALTEDREAVLAFGPMREFGGKQQELYPEQPLSGGVMQQTFIEKNLIVSPGQTLIRASAIEKCGNFDPDIWGADDWDLYIRLSVSGTFHYQHKLALHYRIHEANASRNHFRMRANVLKVYRKHFRLDKDRSLSRWLFGPPWFQNLFATQHGNTAMEALAKEQYLKAAFHWWQGMCKEPARLFRVSGWRPLLGTYRRYLRRQVHADRS